jgi:hypothetical protein
VSFAIFAVLGIVWATALPLFGSPDEPAHVTRAVSVARGEWIGDKVPGLTGGWRSVRVPEVVRSGNDVGCYAFRNDVPANCLDYRGSDRLVRARTTAGTYFPAYYLITGLPSLVTAQARGVYLMRFLSAIVCGALLASALAAVRTFPNARIGAIGLAVAVTPMVLFVNGTVNPSSVEISAAIAAWASAFALIAAPTDAPLDRRLVVRVAVVFSVLGLARLFAPMWIVAILGAAGLVAGMTVVRRLLRERSLRIAALVVALATLAQLAWNVVIRPVDTGTSVDISRYELIRNTIGRSGFFYDTMIGDFGWLTVKSPYLTIVVWTAAIGVLLMVGLAVSSRRASIALLLVAAATALLPLVSEYREVPIIGPFWQGRYTLPLAVGVPIVGAYLIGTSSIGARLVRSRLALVVGIALGVGQFLGFAQTLRRFTVGSNGPFKYWVDAPWAPPLGALPLTLAFVVALVVWLVWMLGPTPEDLEPVS